MTGWLLGTLLATSGLILLVLLIREPVRRHFGSRVAYGLWLIPGARMLMPTMTETVERTVPAGSPVLPLIQPTVGEPLLLSNVATQAPTLLDQFGGWPTVLLTLWLGVAIGIFLSRFTAFLRDRRAILARGMEIGRIGPIRVVQSAEVSSPVAFGIVDRVIAIPAAFERLYNERERRYALDHELSHHRSGDLVANVFAFVLLCLQWFNPLAWVAHAAFRFDQEAACDARVLDKAQADDRAGYGRAIAKAASGRALMFASALDRRNTLHRRLRSMLNNTSAGTRTVGRVMILAAAGIALPLTATRAVEYINVPAAAAPAALAAAPKTSAVPPTPAILAVEAAAPIAAVPQAVPIPSTPPAGNHRGVSIEHDTVTINGQSRRWEELTPQERQEVRRELAEAREELAQTRIDRAEIEREVREALEDARLDRAELNRDLAETKIEIEQAMREIDANAIHIRRAGHDPEAIKAQVRVSLKAVEAIDVEAIRRQALASVDPARIAASVAAAEASVAKAQAELDRLEERLDDD